MLKVVPTSGLETHRKLLNTVLGSKFTFISGVDPGSIINRFKQDLMFLDSRLPLSLLNTLCGLLLCLVQVVLVVLLAIYLLATLPVLGGLLTTLQHFYLRTSKQLRQFDLQSKSGLHTKLSASYEGLVTIRAQGWQHILRREFREKSDRSQEPFCLLYLVQTWLRLVLNFLVAGLAVSVIGVAVALRNTASASGIELSVFNLVSLGHALQDFIIPWTTLETSLRAIARIEAFEIDTPQELTDANSADNIPPEWPRCGEVLFDKVWSTYLQAGETPVWALQDISFRVRAGEKVAICGRTGSGKSTLLLSLLALIDIPRGAIRIDGTDISKLPQSTVRSSTAIVPRDPYVEEGDATRAAINPENDVSDEAVMGVLRDCGLMDKVNASGGLDSALAEVSFSAGELQLFVLARTIIKAGGRQGGLLLLGEATSRAARTEKFSSIDVSTEATIMEIIQRRLPGMTVISILHRLESGLKFDRIIVLGKGEVSVVGTPEEVIRKSELFTSFRKHT